MNKLVESLAKAEVFGQLSEKQRQELADLAIWRSLKKGDVLCEQEEYWPFVLLIAKGALRSVINSPDGRSYVVGTWEEGEIFWAHSIFDQDPSPSRLEATQPAELYQWNGEAALQIVFRSHMAMRALLRRQTRLIRKRREIIYNLAFNPVASRLARLISEQFLASDKPTVQRDLTLMDMAQMVASSPEVICRLLYQFQAAGTISINRATITLHDRESLEKLILRDK